MLDQLNEQLVEARRGAGRLRQRLPRGHLRHLRAGDQRRRPRARARAAPPASCACATSRTAPPSPSSRSAPRAFPVIKDLVVDRSAFDRIMQRAATSRANAGSAPDANAIPIPKDAADKAMDAAACIGCGACVAACPNASASLFVSAKIAQLALLPQGQPERERRALAHGRSRWTPRASATAPTTASARRSAPRRSRSRTSRACGASSLARRAAGRPRPATESSRRGIGGRACGRGDSCG